MLKLYRRVIALDDEPLPQQFRRVAYLVAESDRAAFEKTVRLLVVEKVIPRLWREIVETGFKRSAVQSVR